MSTTKSEIPNPKSEIVDIPEGYRADAKGRLVPESAIKPIDLQRDALVAEIVKSAIQLRDKMRNFRANTYADIAAFADLSAEKYNAPIGGVKGNLTLMSHDGKYKIQRAMADVLEFDERLQAAKALIDKCLTRWAKGSDDKIKTLVSDAFQVDRAGNINTGRVLSLRRFDFEDEDWKSAMTAISDSLLVSSTRTYLRVYERVAATGAYIPINLDLANA